MITTIKISELVNDPTIYPRTQVSSVNVTNLVYVLETGNQFREPPVVDAESKRIADGVHRWLAYRKVLGPDAEIEVDLRDFASDTELRLYAIESNTAHGLQLQEFEKRRAVDTLGKEGVSDDVIAKALHVPPDKVIKFRSQMAIVRGNDGAEIRKQPLKRSTFHFQGKPMTESQSTAHSSAPGVPYLTIVEQLRKGISGDLINKDDGRLIQALKGLCGEIEQLLAVAES